GTAFGDWRVTAFIGRGGNGEVYCAEHVTLGTPAAVKVLVRDEERARVRFAREAKMLSELKSTSFPKFFADGEANGWPYIAMELLEPDDLPTGDKAVAKFVLKVCDAVAELHARGLVHRDIKPGNILWRSSTEPVLADLGLVKAADDVANATLNSQLLTLNSQLSTSHGVGTPGYGAPEQMERGEVSFAADVHALGVLADHCFAGKPPRTWARIIERATSSIPTRRYPSVAAFARAIRWRNLFLKMALAVACISFIAVIGFVLRRLLVPFAQPPYVTHQAKEESQPEPAAPILFASAMLNGAETKDVRWFLDDKQIEMPYRLDEADERGKIRSYKWLRAVAWRNGKMYSAKEGGGLHGWKGERRFSLTLREDPAAGTALRILSPGGVPFDFVWCPPGKDDPGAVGYGYWLSVHGLTGRQLGAIVQEGLLYTPFAATKRYDFSSNEPVQLEHPETMTIPVFSFHDAGVIMGPLSAMQLEDAVRRTGGADAGMRLVATSGFENETNTVLHCAALSLLQSGSPDAVLQGEKMLQSFTDSDDEEFAALAREICVERGVLSLESCGANPLPRFRRAAIRCGNKRTLERLAATDPDSEIRTEAYEKLQNPSQMLSAKYLARITADFSGDIGEPIKIIEKMTDRAALGYIVENATLEYFQDLAKDRLARIKK
ncbi:MAG: serine/threonine protein kinase, partial [Kiritimatiellae bacterium]|nr:serine/threonine protein kinase [Kiritimatiellia bacterium]